MLYNGIFTLQLAITQLVKFDMETKSKIVWENKDRNLEPGEPVFIKAPNGQEEDDGRLESNWFLFYATWSQ